jgi:hypothetical protein
MDKTTIMDLAMELYFENSAVNRNKLMVIVGKKFPPLDFDERVEVCEKIEFIFYGELINEFIKIKNERKKSKKK